MSGPGEDINDLAARIAAIEASGAVKPAGPRGVGPPSGAAATQAELDALRVAAEAAPPSGEDGAAKPVEAPLPVRDVDADRGPSLVSLEGQAAHDEALGVLPDGTEVRAPRPKRKKKAPKAELSFADAAPHQRAIELAYKLVSQRERTVKQVREKLAAKECEPPAIDAAIAELGRYGFIDDARYARLFAEDKRRLQGWGAMRIKMALRQDGISREILDALFADDEEALDAPSELEAAMELLRRKQPDLSDVKVKSRMAGMLARRGIASPVVFQALRLHERGGDE